MLFDSGPVPPELAGTRNHRPINDLISLTDALTTLDLTPRDIDYVVLSHLHWDHSYNLGLFDTQPIYVQRWEIQFAIAPIPCQNVACNVHTGNGLPQWCGVLAPRPCPPMMNASSNDPSTAVDLTPCAPAAPTRSGRSWSSRCR